LKIEVFVSFIDSLSLISQSVIHNEKSKEKQLDRAEQRKIKVFEIN